jgi:hypothetical protein
VRHERQPGAAAADWVIIKYFISEMARQFAKKRISIIFFLPRLHEVKVP